MVRSSPLTPGVHVVQRETQLQGNGNEHGLACPQDPRGQAVALEEQPKHAGRGVPVAQANGFPLPSGYRPPDPGPQPRISFQPGWEQAVRSAQRISGETPHLDFHPYIQLWFGICLAPSPATTEEERQVRRTAGSSSGDDGGVDAPKETVRRGTLLTVSGPVQSALQKEGMQRAALGLLRSHLERLPSLLLTFTDKSRDLSDPTKSRDCPSCDWKDEKPCRQRDPEDAPQTRPETNPLGELTGYPLGEVSGVVQCRGSHSHPSLRCGKAFLGPGTLQSFLQPLLCVREGRAGWASAIEGIPSHLPLGRIRGPGSGAMEQMPRERREPWLPADQDGFKVQAELLRAASRAEQRLRSGEGQAAQLSLVTSSDRPMGIDSPEGAARLGISILQTGSSSLRNIPSDVLVTGVFE
ncbi:unnamed protein product [Rangifer tarandus platyrhynchus]|uniref:Uncharacterized protein n=1 Tax=Rangifer tarandus platyrhynchus TaxID=3082113 RepID=A0ABN8ZJ74_RANTA|nr:unnamed protein product [Rangifer tarandus platyrhynchus]